MGILKGRLDNSEIKDALLSNDILINKIGFTEEDADEILQTFWFHDFYNSFLSFPLVYECLEKYLISNSTNKVNRNDLYEFIIATEIDEGCRDKLYSLGFILELFQQNGLEEKAFYSLCKQLKIPRNKLPSKLILKEVVNGVEQIQFLHHSLQEYLAYKYLVTQKNTLDLVKSTVVLEQEGIQAYKSTWSGVVRFLLFSGNKSDVLQWLVTFLSKNPINLTDDLADLLTSIETADLNVNLLRDIFELIYKHYQRNAIWIPVWTRLHLWRFIYPDFKNVLKEDTEISENTSCDSERSYVARGNVASLIGPIIENRSDFFTKTEKDWWYRLLVSCAISKEGNGVLQRQALSSLEAYKKEDVLDKTKDAYEFNAQLVKEAYLQLCYTVAPNSEFSIDYFVRAIKEGHVIYGRMGIYEITKTKSISYLIDKFISDTSFLQQFLDKESIFGGQREKERTDRVLLQRISDSIHEDPAVLKKLKELAKAGIALECGYYARRSYFVSEIIKLITNADDDYIKQIFEDIKTSSDPRVRLIDYEEVFPFILTDENLQFFSDEVVPFAKNHNLPRYGYLVDPYRRTPEIVNALEDKSSDVNIEDVGIARDLRSEEIYKEFAQKLEPEKGRFSTDVFDFYLNNEDIISEQLKKEDKDKLLTLISNILENASPEKIQVRITDKTSGGKHYTITPYASYFGGVVRLSLKLNGKEFLKKYRQKIINFIPFAYYNDQQTILDVVDKVTDADLEDVNKIYSPKSENEGRYLIPGSYTYVIKQFLGRGCKFETPLQILKTFVEDGLLEPYEKRSALELIGAFMENGIGRDEDYLTNLFEKHINDTTEAGKYMTEVSNRLLIKIFYDPFSISWRFQEIKASASPFEREEGVHSVGPIEEELDDMYFAKPLMELQELRFMPNYIDLLDFSVSLLSRKDHSDYWNYINYLWRIVTQYVKGLTYLKTFEPYFKLKNWYELREGVNRINWFGKTLEDIFNFYVFELGKIEVQKAVKEHSREDA